ncbi:hypothetical protein KIP88_18830 [Bradyrhizobium sp. SRL28]|uniref:hypothetical protein n=1 Tax=Bradyrhizobium sp. SRL28 TaxID=2836178 RepID=UPI001BDF04D5|nr:hypothetical protein [Bradyrhizobium sp. SRL28]MBT1512562.1 hypothetical protein [Bradyrhizobium sp. SRL28]
MSTAVLANKIAAAALVVSIAAFGVSIRSCAISEEAQVQSRTQFKQERQLILTATFQKNDKEDCTSTIKVTPIGSDFKFQAGYAVLPPSMFKEPIPIANDGTFLRMGDICFRLQAFVKSQVKPEKGAIKVGEGAIPLIIKSSYAVRGMAYDDVSLYVLDTMIMVREEESDPVWISFKGLSFAERMSPFATVDRNLLDSLMNSRGFSLPPRTP